MANLPYVGATPASPTDLVTKSYVGGLSAGNMTQTAVDSQLTSGFSPYPLKSYVDGRDALNATPAFVDAGDATRLHLSQIGANNGIAGLLSSGKVEVARVPVASTQRWPSPFISPSAYHSSTITATGLAETQLFPVTVAYPGYTYKLLVTGVLDGQTGTDGQYPIVRVRQGSTTGTIVAVGNGIGETFVVGGNLTSYSTNGSYTYTVPTGYTNLDIICLGAGGGGSSFWGQGGNAGSFASSSLVYGTTLPLTTTTLAVTVGKGGKDGSTAGTASKVTGTGITTVTGAGGAGNGQTTNKGQAAGSLVLDGQTYQGGGQSLANGPGLAPGGGGGGGAASDQPGADGEVWFFAYSSSTGASSGPIRIIPTGYDQQTALTGSTTLYAMLSSSGSGSVSVSTLRPGLMVVPIPA